MTTIPCGMVRTIVNPSWHWSFPKWWSEGKVQNSKGGINFPKRSNWSSKCQSQSECQSIYALVSTNHRAVKWEMKYEMWNVNCKRQKASVLKSQTKCQTAWCQQGGGSFKNAHFQNALSLADLHPHSLSNLFPLCEPCAKVAIICWSHHLECIDQEGATQLKVIGPPPLHP